MIRRKDKTARGKILASYDVQPREDKIKKNKELADGGNSPTR